MIYFGDSAWPCYSNIEDTFYLCEIYTHITGIYLSQIILFTFRFLLGGGWCGLRPPPLELTLISCFVYVLNLVKCLFYIPIYLFHVAKCLHVVCMWGVLFVLLSPCCLWRSVCWMWWSYWGTCCILVQTSPVYSNAN